MLQRKQGMEGQGGGTCGLQSSACRDPGGRVQKPKGRASLGQSLHADGVHAGLLVLLLTSC